jgi:hypothetical protein
LYQGTTSVVPFNPANDDGFSQAKGPALYFPLSSALVSVRPLTRQEDITFAAFNCPYISPKIIQPHYVF